MTIDDMDEIIKKYIFDHDGTEDGERVYRERRNLFDDDYDGIKKLYESIAN